VKSVHYGREVREVRLRSFKVELSIYLYESRRDSCQALVASQVVLLVVFYLRRAPLLFSSLSSRL